MGQRSLYKNWWLSDFYKLLNEKYPGKRGTSFSKLGKVLVGDDLLHFYGFWARWAD